MFFGSDREELVRDMFIAGELRRRGHEQSGDDPLPDEEEFIRALDELRKMQKADFIEIFGAMSGCR